MFSVLSYVSVFPLPAHLLPLRLKPHFDGVQFPVDLGGLRPLPFLRRELGSLPRTGTTAEPKTEDRRSWYSITYR